MKKNRQLFFLCNITFFIIVLIVFPTIQTVKAATIYVPDDYATIQGAINASQDGDTVIVADGTYFENISFPTQAQNKNITLTSKNGPEFTIIDGSNRISTVVLFPAASDSILQGFTITNGSGNGYGIKYGGGILIGAGASPTIDKCIIHDNKASSGGGIACGESSAPLITNSIFFNNLALAPGHSNGGGIHIGENSTPTIINCIFKENYSDISGGAIATNSASPVIVNCTFDNNLALKTGGAIAVANSAMRITNSTFSNNTSLEAPGGAISCAFLEEGDPLPPESTVTNSIFWGDHPAEFVCEENILSVTYSNIQGGPSWAANPELRRTEIWPGIGNINEDPRFLGQLNGDFHLTNDSPCIDAGDNSDPDLHTTDIEGNLRIVGPAVDMGAFEKYLDVASPPTIVSGNEWQPNPNMYAIRTGYSTDASRAERGGGVLAEGLFGEGTYVDYVKVAAQEGGLLGLGGPQDGGFNPQSGSQAAAPGVEDVGGSQGIFGDILKSSVIGYHLDGWTAEGIEIYMPVTQGIKALKGAQEYVRSIAPALAEFVRECFDYLEQKADANKEGSLYNLGTHLFPVLGKIAEESLELIGEKQLMNAAYSNTTISVAEFKQLEKQGQAIAPKIVK